MEALAYHIMTFFAGVVFGAVLLFVLATIELNKRVPVKVERVKPSDLYPPKDNN